jgi:hypothetical protein
MALPHVVSVSGAPRQRGQAYGETLRDAIRGRDAAWRNHIGALSGVAPATFIAAHLDSSDYLTAARRWTPDLLDEVTGIAEGSNLPFADIFAAQLMDEEWLFHQAFRGRAHCSSLGTATPHFAAAAQTMDLPQWMDGFQTILSVTDEAGLSALVLTAAGMVGLCGMNSAGLALSVNTLSELPSSTTGLPVAFVARGVLARPDAAEAAAFLTTVPHAAGQTYVVVDRQAAIDLECSAEGTAGFRPVRAQSGCVWHTNHPLAGGHVVHTGEVEATGGKANSRARFASMEARLMATGGAMDLDAVKSVLASRDDAHFPISRPRHAVSDHGFTFAAVIWQVSPLLAAHVAAGPPHETAYQPFAFAA